MKPTPAPRRSDTTARLWLPRPALVTCIRGVMLRDTRAAVLADHERFSCFPASPLCTLTWWLQGDSDVLPLGQGYPSLATPRQVLGTRLVLGGPQTRPLAGWAHGPAHVLMLLLQPDALHRLTGLDIAAWVDRWGDATPVLPPDWVAMAQALPTLPDDEARVAALQDFLQPRWQAVRPQQAQRPPQAQRFHDWAQSLALQAALSGPGKSLRQVERRIKRWAGLPMRDIRGFSRSEQAFFAVAEGEAAGAFPQGPNWAELADAQGYADQSHLSRETRRVTGFPPDEFHRLVRQDECFWSYRLWV